MIWIIVCVKHDSGSMWHNNVRVSTIGPGHINIIIIGTHKMFSQKMPFVSDQTSCPSPTVQTLSPPCVWVWHHRHHDTSAEVHWDLAVRVLSGDLVLPSPRQVLREMRRGGETLLVAGFPHTCHLAPPTLFPPLPPPLQCHCSWMINSGHLTEVSLQYYFLSIRNTKLKGKQHFLLNSLFDSHFMFFISFPISKSKSLKLLWHAFKVNSINFYVKTRPSAQTAS